MEQSWEIIGIVLAVLMVIIGLRLLLKKPNPEALVKLDQLPVEQDSQQPVVPRAVREILQQESAQQSQVDEKVEHIEPTSEFKADVCDEPTSLATCLKAEEDELTQLKKELQDEPELVEEAKSIAEEQKTEIEPADDKHTRRDMQKLDFEDDELLSEITVLDAHLSEQDRSDEESALAKASKIVALYVYPNPERALSGERTLKMLLKYGLRYGEMKCFHRYEDTEASSSPLMFSVLRIDDDGAPVGFDLEALPTDEVKGLAFFLALPNPKAVQGFDMMVSISGLIARDTDGLVFDEQSLELTPQLREHWRHYVMEYNPEQEQHHLD